MPIIVISLNLKFNVATTPSMADSISAVGPGHVPECMIQDDQTSNR